MIAKQDWRYVSGGGRVVRNAHEPSTEITGLAFASNGNSIATRGADETLKVLFKLNCMSVVGHFSPVDYLHCQLHCSLMLQKRNSHSD